MKIPGGEMENREVESGCFGGSKRGHKQEARPIWLYSK